ncbi:MAG: chromosomal replication initiator protein DnaA [Chloroflexi bacterium]|nr:chromosomal replication initiator protein DnaA [Chloroflexota bacterium]
MTTLRSSSRDLWRAVLGELELQLPRPTFETWLKNTEGVSHDERQFVVAVPTAFAVEWLERRMYQAIHKAVEKVAQRPLDVQFRVDIDPSDDGEPAASPELSSVLEPGPATDTDLAQRQRQRLTRPLFNSRYTFDNFVVGECNQLAYSAAQAVAEAPGEAYNPLFLYSGVGLGKTHLLHAIGHICASRGQSVLYVTSEQFTNHFISAIRNRTTEDFRSHYRGVQVLLMDDVQFLSGKEQTHEGFFHTFNDLHTSGRQVVITSDRPPSALTLLQDRMRSRFEWGLIADIEPPGLETRMAILASKAALLKISIGDDIIELIAKRVQKNVRELEGSLNRIVAYLQLMNVDITYESTSRILDAVGSDSDRHNIEPESIIEKVASHYKFDTDVLTGRRRTKKIALARQVAMYLLIYELEMSPTQVGRMLGGRDHATVIHGAGKINGEISEDRQLRQDVLAIKEAIFS